MSHDGETISPKGHRWLRRTMLVATVIAVLLVIYVASYFVVRNKNVDPDMVAIGYGTRLHVYPLSNQVAGMLHFNAAIIDPTYVIADRFGGCVCFIPEWNAKISHRFAARIFAPLEWVEIRIGGYDLLTSEDYRAWQAEDAVQMTINGVEMRLPIDGTLEELLIEMEEEAAE